MLLNILLFIPLGVGLRLSGVRTWMVFVCGLGVSLLAETLQLTVIPGRDASLSDLVTNTLGTWAGAMAGKHLTRLLLPTEGQATSLALGGALAWLAVQAGTAILLRPWAPDEIRGGAWARAAPDRIPFDGTVTAAVVSGWVIPNGLMPVPELATKLSQGDVRLEVRLLSGSHAAVWSPVFELLGPRGAVLSLEAVGRDLAFHPPAQSSRLRLRRPALRLDAALPPACGIPLRVTAQARGDTLSASWSIAGGPNFRSLQVLGPSLGWSLITPIRYALGPEVRWITAVWIAGWLAVIGYWSAARRAPPLVFVLGVTLLLFTGLALVPGVLSYPVSHWTEWLAGAAGAGIGHAGHHFAAYLGKRCDSPSIKEFC
ncbi:MAG TPA: VanZ family protein [Gemmatimonadales bacterium]